MKDVTEVRSWRAWTPALVVAVAGLVLSGVVTAQMTDRGPMKSGQFSGKKVNAGYVMFESRGGARELSLSDEFVAPDAPDPHWQVVDSKGNAYLLNRVNVKGLVGDKLKKSVTVPPYVPDVAKVQIWCAWAEVVLGEAAFSATVK